VADYTFDPNNTDSGITLSNGNLTAMDNGTGGSYAACYATLSKTTGKWYWEVTLDAAPAEDPWTDLCHGICEAGYDLTSYLGADDTSYMVWGYDGDSYYDDSGQAYSESIDIGQVMGFGLDLDNGELWMSLNGVWQGISPNGDILNRIHPMYTGVTGPTFPAISTENEGDQVTINFGATPFVYPIPTGYSAYTPPGDPPSDEILFDNVSLSGLTTV
jgi:hypothetical protein